MNAHSPKSRLIAPARLLLSLVVLCSLLLMGCPLVDEAGPSPGMVTLEPATPQATASAPAEAPAAARPPARLASGTPSVEVDAEAEPRPGDSGDDAPVLSADEFQKEIATYLGERDGRYGLAVLDLDSGETVLLDAERSFPSASTYKVLAMYVTYRQIEDGELSLADRLTIVPADTAEEEPEAGLQLGDSVSVAEALDAMIAVSSNYAAYALVRLTGGWASLDAAAATLDMGQTGMGSQSFQTTPADMLVFMERLARGELVSARASARMIVLLQRQTKTDRIPALLPEEAIVAHKTGELPGVRNDVGIVQGPGGRFAISAFSIASDEEGAARAIAEVARRAYDRYAR